MWGIMGRKVLVVDDAAFMRMMLKDILVKNDFEVAGEAENGNVAVAAYQKIRPDIVTMDITMPEMNGIEAVKAIKAIDPDSKIIMVSAMGRNIFPSMPSRVRMGRNTIMMMPTPNATGLATCTVTLSLPGTYTLGVQYAGSSTLRPASASRPFAVTAAIDRIFADGFESP